MAKRNLKKDDVIVKITFDMRYKGKQYKNITLDYKPDKYWCLTWEDCHGEDNDSWNCVGVKDAQGNEDYCIDFQIHGEDDCLPWNKNNLWIDGVEMYKEEGVEGWQHGEDWVSYDNVKFSNVTIHTKNGKSEKIRVQQWYEC